MGAVNQLVLLEDRGAVRVLTMEPPEARNALSTGLISALYSVLIDADRDASLRAVVLTGADPAFCAGLDLKQAQRDASAYFERLHAENCIAKVAQLGKPILGAINGPAITGGMEIALGCDINEYALADVALARSEFHAVFDGALRAPTAGGGTD